LIGQGSWCEMCHDVSGVERNVVQQGDRDLKAE
jgi:hypothetical protein